MLIWRRGLQPHFRSIGKLEAAALLHLEAGVSFAGLCARLAEQFNDLAIPADAGRLLRRWVEEELLKR